MEQKMSDGEKLLMGVGVGLVNMILPADSALKQLQFLT